MALDLKSNEVFYLYYFSIVRTLKYENDYCGVSYLHFEPLQIGKTRRLVAMAYGKRCGKANLSVLEDLVNISFSLGPLLYVSLR